MVLGFGSRVVVGGFRAPDGGGGGGWILLAIPSMMISASSTVCELLLRHDVPA